MKELYVFCEGATEQGFCKRVLEPYLFPDFSGCIHPVRIANSRRKNVITRGGVSRSFLPMKNEMVRELSRHKRPNVLFTSMIDLYALPGDFPGKSDNVRNLSNPRLFVEKLENAFGAIFGDSRFLPHLQLYEFETLIFVDPSALEGSFENIGGEIEALIEVTREFGDVEKINDSPNGAPSKRIEHHIPRFERLKSTVGPDVVSRIGMSRLLENCGHFRDWIQMLVARLSAP